MSRDGVRYHALDSLRASMMFLGLVIHAAMSYTTWDTGWQYKYSANHPVFDLLVFWIHIFRMPVFFMVAGFFALFLYQRGIGRMMVNRFQRIVLPFVVFWLVLFPFTRMADTYASHAGEAGAFGEAVAFLMSGEIFARPRTLHLWFLYYLAMFLATFAFVAPMLRRLETGLARDVTRWVWRSRLGPMLPALATAATLLMMQGGVLEVSSRFTPSLSVFLGYGVFFAFGVLLYRCRDELSAATRHLWWHLGAGMLASTLFLVAFIRRDLLPAPVDAFLGAAATWYLCLASFAAFDRWANRESRTWRYLSDASYWVYLLHMPLTIWIPALLARLDAPAGIKFALTLAATTAICLLTYHFLVRYSSIGKLLNGRIPNREKLAIPDQMPQPNCELRTATCVSR